MPIILDNDDCGWVATLTTLDNRPGVANRQTQRHFIAYIQRQVEPRNKIILREDVEDMLGPILWMAPGPKEGIVQLDCLGADTIRITYTGRIPGDESGPFRLQREYVSVPGIFPIGIAACNRVRNVAQLIAKYVPASAEQIAPYTK